MKSDKFFVNDKGELIETIVFQVSEDFKINSISEHIIFGIYFSFNYNFNTDKY